jgi:hypothetical protein
MPANHRIDTDARIIFTSWEGDATDADLYEALKLYYENIRNKSDNSDFDEVVSFSNAATVKVSAKGMMDLAKLASSADQPGVNTRLAFVTSSSLTRSFANLYATYRSVILKTGKTIRVFDNDENALKWISTES